MDEKQHRELIKSIERIEKAFQQRIIIELYRSGIPQSTIGKNLGIGAGVVNKLLKGIKKDNSNKLETEDNPKKLRKITRKIKSKKRK